MCCARTLFFCVFVRLQVRMKDDPVPGGPFQQRTVTAVLSAVLSAACGVPLQAPRVADVYRRLGVAVIAKGGRPA